MNSGYKSKAIFLDRDGTLINNVPYLKDPSRISLIPGCVDVLRTLKERGFLLVVVTNQSGIGRGLLSEKELKNVHDHLQAELMQKRVQIDHFYYCPHLPENINPNPCDCRKPKPKLFLDAIHKLQINPKQSFTIGDSLSDLEAGHQVGTKTILFDPQSSKNGLPKWIHGKFQTWNEVLVLIGNII